MRMSLEGVEERGMGVSRVMERRVSAATMPPIEWPMRITRTPGSMVGEGVFWATSRSMTLFCSLVGLLVGGQRGQLGRLPFFEGGYAFC